MTGTDSGLLAPVWAGTEAAALVDDQAWLAAMLKVEVALARAQATLGIIPPEAAEIIAATAADGVELRTVAERARDAANPVVALVDLLTAAVARRDSAAAEFVHRGGTSQDILDSAAMLIGARACAAIEADLRRTAVALRDRVREHRDTPMAGRTLTQHAVPITFGLKAAGWLELVLTALERVRLLRGGLPAQLGGAAGTLASYVEYARVAGREVTGTALLAAFARELGLTEPVLPWHALRVPIADLGATLSLVTGALGKFALDVQVMSRTEIAEVSEPAATGRGVSSAMPQKRNPVLATLIVSAARQVPAHALILTQALLGEDERSAGAWHSEWQPLRECLRLTAGAARTAAELAEGLTAFPDRMAENLALTGGTIVSERLNAVLAGGLGKAAAKKLLARLSHDGGSFTDRLAATPAISTLLGASIAHLCAPDTYLGAATELVDRHLTRASTVLDT